jgi:carboxymethylenebutenolidase
MMRMRTQVDLVTADGHSSTSLFQPDPAADGNDKGPWPAVILFMDGVGIRPALFEIAERIAAGGYLVALPDLFYRSGSYDPVELRKSILDPSTRAEWARQYYRPAVANVETDTGALLAYLATRSDVVQPSVGTTGYCMGGNISLRAAALFPDRVAACASFHGGFLVTDTPDSPHRQAGRIKAQVLVAAAIEDGSFTDEHQRILGESLTQAGVSYQMATWPARHGWVPRDSMVYDAAQSERHYAELLPFFDQILKRPA